TDPTDPPADTTPPTTPTGLTAGTSTTTSIPLTWSASTDDVGVTGYDVYQGTVKIATSTTTSYSVAALTPDTAYTFTVRAKDAAGNTSPASTPVTARTQPTTTPAGACQVVYTTNDWNSGFTGSVKITNTSTTALTAWTLGFTFPAGQQINQGWSAIFTQTATTVTATNQAWNGTLAAGATIDIGFNATHTGTNTPPTTFTLNGTTCS
ncbi:cellulose binding domain-containing protein, partial [Sanguibacter sp. 26GB23]|uniref:cellulose binding domain-containing protein n=1 Tax=Sanguibacter sp. 26GB23 TaxID=3156066 RepID=UPI0032AECE69